MLLRRALLCASIAVIGCGTDSTVWPYADSAGEGGGTWLATGFCGTSAIAANDTDVFVLSCSELVHTSAHLPKAEEMNGYDNLRDTGYVTAVAVDTDNLYFAKPNGDWDYGVAGNAHGWIYRRSIASGSLVGLAQSDNPIALAIDGSNVYWIEGPEDTTTSTSCSLHTTPKSGGAATTTLAANLPAIVAIAVGSSDIYLATFNSILAVAKDGSLPPATIASEQETPTAITARDSTVWWTTQGKTRSGPGGLFSATSGGAIQTLATDLYGPTSVAVDGARVYFSSDQVRGQPSGITVMSMPLDGGAKKILGWGQGDPIYLAATSSALYWTDAEGDSLTAGSIKVAESE